MTRRAALALLALLALPYSVGAKDLQPGPHVLKPLSDDFQRLADLEGEWRGILEEGPEGHSQPITVEYSLSSGNSALIERLFKGTPMELTTVYHDAGEGLMATHYCGLGNQPRYRSSGFEENTVTFDFVDGSNMESPDERHMHEVKIAMLAPDKIRHEWNHYEGGKQTMTVVVELTRVE